MNIQQFSPTKLGEFFHNNILYSKSSKNNSITLSQMIDETDLNARQIFEQPKTNKNVTKKGYIKSPISVSRLKKSTRGNKQRKSSRHDKRVMRKSCAPNFNILTAKHGSNFAQQIINDTNETMIENKDDNSRSLSRTKKAVTRKSQPLTTTNMHKGNLFMREPSEDRSSIQQNGNTQHSRRESNVQKKNVKNSRGGDSIERASLKSKESKKSKKQVMQYIHKQGPSKNAKQLQLDIAAAEATYQEQLLNQQTLLSDIAA